MSNSNKSKAKPATLLQKLKAFRLSPLNFQDTFGIFFSESIWEQVNAITSSSTTNDQNNRNVAKQTPSSDNKINLESHQTMLAKSEVDNANMNEVKKYSNPDLNFKADNDKKDNFGPENSNNDSGLACFLKGLFWEYGWKGQKGDPQKAFQWYKRGVREQQDAFCAYRLAQLYGSESSLKLFGIQMNLEISYAYLSICDAWIDVWYSSHLINLEKDLQSVSSDDNQIFEIAIEAIESHKKMIFDNQTEIQVDKSVALITCLLRFKHSSLENAQREYVAMIEYLGRNQGAQIFTLFVKILSIQTHNADKLVARIIEHCRVYPPSLMSKALKWILQDVSIVSLLGKDHDIFNSTRTTFMEMHTLLKILSLDSQIITRNYQDNAINSALRKQIFEIASLIYHKKSIFKNYIHNVLIIRIFSQLHNQGVGTNADSVEALNIIEEDIQLKKNSPSLFAYYYYKKGRLLERLSGSKEDIKICLDKATELFIERQQTSDISGQCFSSYYLGRILFGQKQYQKSREQFIKVNEIFSEYPEIFCAVKTFQFEFIRRKNQRKLDEIDHIQENDAPMSSSIPKQRKFNLDELNSLESKIQVISRECGLSFFQSSIFKITGLIGQRQVGSTSKASVLRQFRGEKRMKKDDDESPINEEILEDTSSKNDSIFCEFGGGGQDHSEVIIKQIPLNLNIYMEKIFCHLSDLQKITNKTGILSVIGFCVNQIAEQSYELWMIYPKMPYNLYSAMKQSLLNPFSKRIAFALSLTKSLMNLHNIKLCHGNIKPSNVLIDSEFHPLLSDWEFGTKMTKYYQGDKVNAKDSQDDLESANIEDDWLEEDLIFTDIYIAPEVFPNKVKVDDSLADIWSLGMVFLFLFSGQDPNFSGVFKEGGQKFYNKNNLKIPANMIESKIISNMIESMGNHDPKRRITLQKVIDILTVELK